MPTAGSGRYPSMKVFITPFGRYYLNRLPFDIASAPEHFQKQMETILAGQEGVLCHMDDVLIFGRTQQEHDARLHAALQKIQAAGATLNLEKCEFYRDRLTFVGHVIDEQGVSPDPHKTSAIVAWRDQKPQQKSEDFWVWSINWENSLPTLPKCPSHCASSLAVRSRGCGAHLKSPHLRR